jgi:hypothetical protein
MENESGILPLRLPGINQVVVNPVLSILPRLLLTPHFLISAFFAPVTHSQLLLTD